MAMNLDDIFGDVMFTPDGETVFLSEEKEGMLNSGEGDDVKIYCTKNGQAVAQGGGLDTTNLADPSKEALVMGDSATKKVPASQAVPWKEAPQKKNQLEYAAPKKKKKGDKKYVLSDRNSISLLLCSNAVICCLKLRLMGDKH